MKKFHEESSQVHDKFQTCQLCCHGTHDLISLPEFARSEMKKRWDMASVA
jgi:hypothetical protein